MNQEQFNALLQMLNNTMIRLGEGIDLIGAQQREQQHRYQQQQEQQQHWQEGQQQQWQNWQEQQRQEGAGAPREPKLDKGTFPELKMTKDCTEAQKMTRFVAWESGVRNVLVATDALNRIAHFPRIAGAIIGSFSDEAAELATNVSANDYANIDALMTALQELFCGAAVREKSYNLFHEAKQDAKEDLNAYWTRVQFLWLRAFEQADRSQSQLIRTFIAGLFNKKLQNRLVLREGGLPQDYVEIRTVALQVAGQMETADLMAAGKKTNWTPGGGGGGRGGPVPMDVGAAARGGHGGAPRGGFGRGQGAGRGRGGANPGRGPRDDRNQCRKCGQQGHWQRQCPENRRDKNAAGGGVNHVEPEEVLVDGTHSESDETPEDWTPEDWGGVNHLGPEAGNA